MIPSLAPLTNRLRRRLAAAVAVAVTAFLPLAAPTAPIAQAADGPASGADAGYWMLGIDGKVYAFGDAQQAVFGDVKGALPSGVKAVHIEPTPTGKGYWINDDRGGVHAFGDAAKLGGINASALQGDEQVTSLSATPSGAGYWLFTSKGRVFTFGDAGNFGGLGHLKLNGPVQSSIPTPTGKGYFMVGSDGGVFAFGDAEFLGSMGGVRLNKPVMSLVPTRDKLGYWLVASDGGIFAFGNAPFKGSMGATKLNKPVVGMVRYGDGYLMVAADGGIFSFSNKAFAGSLGANPPANPIVGTTALPEPGTPSGSTTTNTGGTTTTTGPTTGTTLPPYSGPMRFSSTALTSWGTPPDPNKSRVNQNGETVFPYAEKVAAIVEIGNRVYIGGSFTNLHQNNHPKTPTMADPPMDYVAELDTNGIPVPGSAFNANVSFDGPVRTLQSSPDGRRLYVGGEFNKVNGETRRRLVALDPATGQIDRTFNPPQPNAYVAAIAQHGPLVYVGGAFANLDGTGRPGLAALNFDGSLNQGFVPPPRYPGRFEGQAGSRVENPTSGDTSGTVDSLLVTRDGKYLMVGGSFLHFGYDHDADPGHMHGGLIAVDPGTGGLTSWQPEFVANSKSKGSRPVFGMANYLGNPKDIGIDAPALIFTATGGVGGRVIAWTPGGKATQLWRAGVDGDALGVAVTHDRVYLVGHFDYALPDADDPCLQIVPVSCPTGTPNRHLVAWHASGEIVDGKHTGKAVFDPGFTAQANTSEGPYTIHLGANRMYVGGNFTEVASSPVAHGAQQFKQPGLAVYPPL